MNFKKRVLLIAPVFALAMLFFCFTGTAHADTLNITCANDGTIYSHDGHCEDARAGVSTSNTTNYYGATNDLYNFNYEIERGFLRCNFTGLNGWPNVTINSAKLHVHVQAQYCPGTGTYHTIYQADPYPIGGFGDSLFNLYSETKLSDDTPSLGFADTNQIFNLNAAGISSIMSQGIGYFMVASVRDIESHDCGGATACYTSYDSTSAADHDNRPYVEVDYSQNTDQTATSTNLYLNIGEFSCCEDVNCAVPVNFGENVNNVAIQYGFDRPICYVDDPANTTVNLDFFSQAPNYLYGTTYSPGNHSVCIIYDYTGGIYSTIKNFYTFASSTDQCRSLMSTHKLQYCQNPCYGIATTTAAWPPTEWHLWGDLWCGLKQTGCDWFWPSDDAIGFAKETANRIPTAMPLSVINSLHSDLINAATSSGKITATVQPGHFNVLVYNTSTKRFENINTNLASGTEAITRKTKTWTIYINYFVLLILPSVLIVMKSV